jgi:hypothetical protein
VPDVVEGERHSIETHFVGVGQLLKDRRLSVPIYQRSYSWQTEKEQVEDFWSDLSGAREEDDKDYFLGTTVLTSGEAPADWTVIDGQQRLATTSMLIAAIRDELFARGDSERGWAVQDEYLTVFDMRERLRRPHLILNVDDDNYFQQLVVMRERTTTGELVPPVAPDARRESHDRITESYEFLRNKVRDVARHHENRWSDELIDWVEFVAHRARVIAVEVPNASDAFLIFETLNDRGLDLTIADLLKNYLFGVADRRLDYVRNNWVAALTTLEAAAEESIFVTFLRHYWSSQHGLVRERVLYKSIKQRIRTSQEAVDFSESLVQAAKHYDAILRWDSEYWIGFGTTTRANIETLSRFSLEQYRPLLLSAMQHFTESELKRLLYSLVCWSVRGLVVGGIGGGKTERAYCDAAKKIRLGELRTASDVYTELSAIIPEDDQFVAAFQHARVTKPRLARYYLLALERLEANDREPVLIPNANEEEVNLEHVLPRNGRAEDWPSFNEEQMKLSVNRLGNMVLLGATENRRLGNGPFADKRETLARVPLKLTKSVGLLEDWTPESIDTRQKQLAQKAKVAWPREP